MTEDTVPASSNSQDEIQQILKKIPDEILIQIISDRILREPSAEIRKVIHEISQHTFSGPLPPPTVLGEYDSIQEGLADRIISMAESQQNHRQQLERRSVDAAITVEKRGQNYALLLSILIIAGSLYLIDSGKEVSGSILAGATLTGLAYIFITGRKKNKKDIDSTKKTS